MDASMTGVKQAEENAALNGLSDRVKFTCADVFELLPELEKKGEQYDVVIPVSYTHLDVYKRQHVGLALLPLIS